MFVSLLLVLDFITSTAQARQLEQGSGQWSPFFFNVTFSHQDKLVIYKFLFRQERGRQLNDLSVKVPSVARFVGADVPSDSASDIPAETLPEFTQLCWQAIASYEAESYYPTLPEMLFQTPWETSG